MAKQLTEEAFNFLKKPSNSATYGKVAELLDVELPTVSNYIGRNRKMFSRHDIVETVAEAMGKPASEIFKEVDEQQEVEA